MCECSRVVRSDGVWVEMVRVNVACLGEGRSGKSVVPPGVQSVPSGGARETYKWWWWCESVRAHERGSVENAVVGVCSCGGVGIVGRS